jgi:hypothetical protein
LASDQFHSRVKSQEIIYSALLGGRQVKDMLSVRSNFNLLS